MKHILIEVVGGVGTGKSLIQQSIAKVLSDAGFTVGVDWGIDGNPHRSDEMVKETLASLKSELVLTISTRTLHRARSKDKS
jgi:Mg-chelatase subunit ChlI